MSPTALYAFATSRRLRTATALICASPMVSKFKTASEACEMNIHQLRTFAEAGVEAFAGVTTAELAGNDTTVRWHYAFTFRLH